jgi:hypothetical protein
VALGGTSPPPAEIACRLARSHFWRDERRRFIGTHPDWPNAAYFLKLEEDLAHGFVLVLSALPAAQRRGFADVYYEERRSSGRESIPGDARTRLALSAAIVLHVIEIADRPDIRNERILDLLHGAAQGDDLTRTTVSSRRGEKGGRSNQARSRIR